MLDAKATVFHWAFLALALAGIIVVMNRITHSDIQPVSAQTGVDITALIIMGSL